MSYIDNRNKILDGLVAEFEREFSSYGTKLKRMVEQFIRQGFTSREEAIRFFAGTGYVDVVNSMISKYDGVLDITRQMSKEIGVPFVLPNTAPGILNLIKDNKVQTLLGANNQIMNTINDSALRFGLGEQSLRTIITDLSSQIDDFTRRLSTEAFTGASIYERTSKLQLFEEAGIELYFYSGPVDSKNRPSCETTLGDSRQSSGWTIDDIVTSSTPFIGAGGYNCRHEWLAFVPGADALVKEMQRDAGITEKLIVEPISAKKPKIFTSKYNISDYDKDAKKWKSELAKTETKELTRYKNDSDYVNNYLRLNKLPRGVQQGLFSKEEFLQGIKDIDSGINKYKLDKDVIVYRGFRLGSFEDALKGKVYDYKKLKGTILEDKGFLSTALSEDRAMYFAGKDFRTQGSGSAVLELRVRKGARTGLLDGVESSHNFEGEFLFKRKLKIKITDVIENAYSNVENAEKMTKLIGEIIE